MDFKKKMNKNLKLRCENCGNEKGKLKRCSGCNCVRYCNKTCQLDDWKKHKSDCRDLKKMFEHESNPDTIEANHHAINDQIDTIRNTPGYDGRAIFGIAKGVNVEELYYSIPAVSDDTLPKTK